MTYFSVIICLMHYRTKRLDKLYGDVLYLVRHFVINFGLLIDIFFFHEMLNRDYLSLGLQLPSISYMAYC